MKPFWLSYLLQLIRVMIFNILFLIFKINLSTKINLIKMSEQPGGLLTLNNSYPFNRERLQAYNKERISSDRFFNWQAEYMYKSTCNQKHGPNMNEPKNTAVPGYTGHIPGVKADSMYGRSNTSLARSCFNSQKLDQNRTGLATTGFNITKDAFIDRSKLASSSKYGKTGLQKAHPSWSQQWQTTNQGTYKPPSQTPNPMYRNTQSVGKKQQNVNSGYSQNHAYLDGHGWKNHPILDPKNIGSEYRDRFNPEQEYHRESQVLTERKLRKSQLNYKYNY